MEKLKLAVETAVPLESFVSDPDWLEDFDHQYDIFKPSAHRLLVVDDDEDQLDLFSSFLSQAGFGIARAQSATEAISIASGQQIDLIVSDLKMPDFDGSDFVRYLRSRNPFRGASHVPVIILSCCDSNTDTHLSDIGADMFCRKNQAVRVLVPQIKFLLG